LGEFEDPSNVPFASYTAETDADTSEGRELSLEAARQSIVLLNNSAGLLPLANPSTTSVAIIGAFANATDFLMGEKSDFSPPYLISFSKGLLGYTDQGGVSSDDDDDDGGGGHDDDTVLDDDGTTAAAPKVKTQKLPKQASASTSNGDDAAVPVSPFASVTVGLGCSDAKCQDSVDSDSFTEAVSVAAAADVAVVTLGIDGTIEKEALDRTDIGEEGS
jgi:hypothetical protein